MRERVKERERERKREKEGAPESPSSCDVARSGPGVLLLSGPVSAESSSSCLLHPLSFISDVVRCVSGAPVFPLLVLPLRVLVVPHISQ